jgi:hypothetical protein
MLSGRGLMLSERGLMLSERGLMGPEETYVGGGMKAHDGRLTQGRCGKEAR